MDAPKALPEALPEALLGASPLQDLPFPEAPIVRPRGRDLPPGLRIPDFARAFFVSPPKSLPKRGRRGPDRLRCFLAVPPPEALDGHPARGTFIVHPGRTEFIEKYFETIEDLAGRGFHVLALDPRGQGLSTRLLPDPLKGFVHRYHDYADDLGWVVAHVGEAVPHLLPRPHILLGHSMGGLAVLQAVLERRAEADLLVASAPMLGLWDIATPVLKYAFRAADRAGVGLRDLPFQRQERGIPIGFENNKLTSDPKRFAAWRDYALHAPEIRVAGPTFRWIAEGLRAMDRVNRQAAKLDIPTLLIAPGADPIVDPASIHEFARRAGADVVTVRGARHEVFMERDVYRDAFWQALDAWLERQGV